MRFLVLAAALTSVLSSPILGQLRDPSIGSRALTDADMTKYVAILGDLTTVRRSLQEPSSVAGMQQIRAATVKACEHQGWGTLDYGVVDARVKTALQHIRMEATVPVPASKKADVELVRQWKARIEGART